MHDEHVSHGAEPSHGTDAGHDPAIPVHDRHGHHVADEHAHSSGMYMRVFYALIICTVLSVAADGLGGIDWLATKFGQMNMKVLVGLIVLGIACCKATFVMLYFMHLKFEGRWKYVLLAPTMILALAIPAALTPDIGVHYYTVQTPQTADKTEPVAHETPHHGEKPGPKH